MLLFITDYTKDMKVVLYEKTLWKKKTVHLLILREFLKKQPEDLQM